MFFQQKLGKFGRLNRSRTNNSVQHVCVCTSSIIGVLFCSLFVYATPYFKDANNEYSYHFYFFCFVINAIYTLSAVAISSSIVAFFARISDKKIGGTYMTFLNTISNMGKSLNNRKGLKLNFCVKHFRLIPNFVSSITDY